VDPWVFSFTSNSPSSSTNKVQVNANLNLASQVQKTDILVGVRNPPSPGGGCVLPSFSSQDITGSLNGSSVSFTITYGGVTLILTGTLAASGQPQTMNGTYAMNGACGTESGTWLGVKVPVVNGPYIASLRGANGATTLNSTIVANLNGPIGGAFSTAGSFSIASTCFKGSLDVFAKQVGAQFGGTATDNLGDSISFGSIVGENIEVTINVDTGSCAGSTGFGTLVAVKSGEGSGGGAITTPPTITLHPASQSVNPGLTATFSVVAKGTSPLSYQWLRNNVAISGANSASYTSQSTIIADSGSQFSVRVSNSAGSANSNVATLTVNAIPPVASVLKIAFAPTQLHFTWTSVIGAEFYRVMQEPDGVSAFTKVGADIAAPAVGLNLDIPVNPEDQTFVRYALDACNPIGCTRSNEIRISVGMLQSIGYIKASNTGAGDVFGSSTALSIDGNTLAVGARAEDSNATGMGGDQTDNSANFSGAVYIFKRSANGLWSQEAYIKPSNTGANDFFGCSLSLSSDGNTLAVGALGEASNATGINGNQLDNSVDLAGAVYVFVRASGVWSQQSYIKASNTDQQDNFGKSVTLSADGNTLAVGASSESSNATGIGGNQFDNSAQDSGAVYVFTRAGNLWSQQAYVKASNTGAFNYFGYSVSLSGDGNTLAVGALGESSNATGINGNQFDNSADRAGAVYVFVRNSGVWSQEAYIKASNTGRQDGFGSSVSLSGDGNTLAVGAGAEDSESVGVGGNQADNSAQDAGAVYVFVRTGSVWSQQSYIKASNTAAHDVFGYTVALSADGNTLAVAAAGESSGALGIGGDQGDNSVFASGAVYLFKRTNATWSQQSYIKATNTGAIDEFGQSLSLNVDGSILVVGADGEDSSATGIGGDPSDNSAIDAGAVYVY
jgi:hypothetical protein